MGDISHQCISDLGSGRKTPIRNFSARLEEQDGHLAQVEVNEMLRLVGDVAPEVPPDDAVPGGVILLVKLLEKGQKKKIREHQIKIQNQWLQSTNPASHITAQAAATIEDPELMSATIFYFGH